LPPAVARDHRIAEPRARLVAQRQRSTVERPGDLERVTRRELLEVGTAGGERRRDLGTGVVLHALALERPDERVAAAEVDGRDAGARPCRQRWLGDDHRQRTDRWNGERARQVAGAMQNAADAELDGQHGQQHYATSHRFHYNRRATSANSRMSNVSARRPGSTPALAAASRAAPTGRPRPLARALANVL